jgi:hypothetical protein
MVDNNAFEMDEQQAPSSGVPLPLMRGFWDRLVLPQLTRLSFDDAVARFTTGLAELFAPFATPEETVVGFFPAEFRADILRAAPSERCCVSGTAACSDSSSRTRSCSSGGRTD